MRERSVIELMVLALTLLVGVVIVTTAGTIAFVEIRDPETDSATAVQWLFGLTGTLVGALLGLLAGKAKLTEELSKRHDEEDE
jgi:hypothetical protein